MKKGLDEAELRGMLEEAGDKVQAIKAGELSLEDVFIHLVKEKAY